MRVSRGLKISALIALIVLSVLLACPPPLYAGGAMVKYPQQRGFYLKGRLLTGQHSAESAERNVKTIWTESRHGT